MSIRDAFENCLVELNKVQAPSLLLDDFVYLFNKAIQQYINTRYTAFETKQQLTDDLRVLLKTHTETISPGKPGSFDGETIKLPTDYVHILNCICVYHVKKQFKCYDKDSYVQFAAKRLTSDTWSSIINDYYNRPLPTRPYYYIHNVNTNNDGTTKINYRTTEKERNFLFCY